MSLSRFTCQNYGLLYSQDECSSLDIPFSHDVGLAVAQMQNKLYGMLVSLTSIILEDFDLSESKLEACKNAKVTALVQNRDSASECPMEAPFYGPAAMDLDLVDALVSSRNHAATSHLLHLRESSPYLRACVKDWTAHIGGRRDDKGILEDDCRAAATLMIHDGYQEAWHWQQVEDKLAQLRSHSPLTWPEWHLVFQELRQHLHSILRHLCERMNEAIPCASTFQLHLERSGYTEGGSRETTTDYKPKESSTPTVKRMYQLFALLCSDDARTVIRPHNLSTEIDRLIEQDPEAGSLMDDWLSEQFSRIAGILELDDYLDRWQPYAAQTSAMAKVAAFNVAEKESILTEWRLKIDEYVYHHPIDPDALELRCSLEAADTYEVLEQQKLSCEWMTGWWAGMDAKFRWTVGQPVDWDGQALPAAMRKLMLAAENLQYPWKWSTLKAPVQRPAAEGERPGKPESASSVGEVTNEPAIVEEKGSSGEKAKSDVGTASLGLEKLSITGERQRKVRVLRSHF